AMQVAGSIFQPAQLGKRRIKVQMLRSTTAYLPPAPRAGASEDSRNPRGRLEQGLLHPLTVFAKAPAMVGPEHNYRVLLQTQILQCRQHSPQLRIRETDRSIVGADCLTPLQFIHSKIRRLRPVRRSRCQL